MLKPTSPQQWLIGTALFMTVVVTRGHHFANLAHLPDASWAVFFLAGVYLRPFWMLPTLLVLAASLDYVAITRYGVSAFCVSPAYGFLLPAYSALWLAGRWYAGRHYFARSTLLPLSLSMLTGAMICELLSSGGFYFFSGRFAEPTLAEFGARLLKYFPSDLQSMTFYVGIAAMVHALFALARNTVHKHEYTAR